MDTGVVIALILGVASIVSSICFGFIPNVRKIKLEKLIKDKEDLKKNIRFYRNLEQNYCKKVSELSEKKENTIKIEMRAEVEKAVGYKLSSNIYE